MGLEETDGRITRNLEKIFCNVVSLLIGRNRTGTRG